MGDITLPRRMFLWSMSVIYMFAFASIYIQIPGLYGNDGILPARWQLRYTGKSLLEQLRDSPTLLWLGPHLGLDTQQGMELICVLGSLLALGAMVLAPLRNSITFLCLWVLYLSLLQVGQVFLYFQWDSLLLETGFLTVLIAPLGLLRDDSQARQLDGVMFWLVRWLLFRLMFASGVVKLTSRCPTWWGLTALTYHYETQCIPTPLAWYAHQLPVWLQKLSVVATFIIEIAAPFLFFSPVRCLRLVAFYLQVLLQVLIILTGNYNFFNLLTITLCLSLLDDDHVCFYIGRAKEAESKTWLEAVVSWLAFLIGLSAIGLIAHLTAVYFGLDINWEEASVATHTEFTYYQFNWFLKTVTLPSIWIGVLSLTWEIIKAMSESACVRGVFWKLAAIARWALFATATVCMFGISTVPYTLIEYESQGSIWPSVAKAHSSVAPYQLVNSYGLFRRMTGVGGRPEVVIEGSMDGVAWTEIEFMYKPGNLSGPPPVVAPHQPRLDWQMWFAALRHHSQTPWFTGLVQRLLQGKKDVIKLIQVDESRYPFSDGPPAFIRASLYKYWFTGPRADGSLPRQWWRRRYVDEFYPTVHLGDPVLESMLSHHGLKDKGVARRTSNVLVPQALRQLRAQVEGLTGPSVLWSLFMTGLTIRLLRALSPMAFRVREPKPDPVETPVETAEGAPSPPAPGPEEVKGKEEVKDEDEFVEEVVKQAEVKEEEVKGKEEVKDEDEFEEEVVKEEEVKEEEVKGKEEVKDEDEFEEEVVKEEEVKGKEEVGEEVVNEEVKDEDEFEEEVVKEEEVKGKEEVKDEDEFEEEVVKEEEVKGKEEVGEEVVNEEVKDEDEFEEEMLNGEFVSDHDGSGDMKTEQEMESEAS